MLSELRTWLSQAPPGTLVPAEVLAEAVGAIAPGTETLPVGRQHTSWRERLWVVPPDTRLGVAELCEAIGRTRSWVYRHTGPNCPEPRIPHRKLESELVFLAGEVRQWVRENELVVVPGGTPDAVVLRKRRPG